MGWTPPNHRDDEDDDDKNAHEYPGGREPLPYPKQGSTLFPRLVLLLVVILFVLAAVRSCGSAHACVTIPPDGNPRIVGLLWSRSWGPPFTKDDGSLDSLRIKHSARYPFVMVPADPSVTSRTDIPALMRYYRPGIRIGMYHLIGYHWTHPPNGSYADNVHTSAAEHWRAINADPEKGWLYDTTGQVWFDNWNVNLGDKPTAQRIAAVMASYLRTKVFDAMWADDIGWSMSWTEGSMGRHLDLKRAGFTSLAQMDSARKVNCQLIVDSLTAACPTCILIGNGSDGLLRVDGDMREGIDAAVEFMSAAQVSVWCDTTARPHPFVKDEGYYLPKDLSMAKNARVNLAAACMGHGWSGFTNNGDGTYGHTQDFWYDEYAVTPYPACRADTTGRYVYWLGAQGDRVKAWDGVSGAELRWYQNGVVLFNHSGAAFTYKLYATFKRIQGVIDPYTNNGKETQTFTVPNNDALFLVRKPPPKPHRP